MDRFLRPKTMAAQLGISVSTLYRMVADGALPKPCVLARDRHGQARIVGWWEGDIEEIKERSKREVA